MLRGGVEIGHPRPRREALLSSLAVAGELQRRVVAERRHRRQLRRETRVEERAVAEHHPVGAVVAETPRLVAEVEAQPQRAAGRERLGQHVVVPHDLGPRRREARRHAEVEGVHLGRTRVVDVEVDDRHGAAVLEPHRTGDAGAAGGRHEVDGEVDRGHRGLRRAGKMPEVALVGGALRVRVVARDVRVQHVRVVVDEAAGGDEQHRRRAGDRPRHRRPPRRRCGEPCAGAAFAAARPQRVGRQQQQDREGAPVQPEPEHRRQEVAVAVHVRIDDVRPARVAVEPVLEAEVGQLGDGEEREQHREVADVLVVDQRVDEQRQRADQQKAGELQHEELEQVVRQVDPGVALRQLDADAAQHDHRQQHRLQHRERRKLGAERQPRRRRQAVGDVGHPGVALAPDELAGIDCGHDQHEQAEQAAGDVEDLVRERLRVGAVQRAHRPGVGDHQQHAGEHDREEARAREDLAHVQAGERGQHPPVGARLKVARRGRERRGARSRVRVGLVGGGVRPPGPLRGQRLHPERAVAERGDERTDGEPERAVPQQHAGERYRLAVLLRDAPVAGEDVDRGDARRIDQRGERLVLHVAQEVERHHVADQHDDAGDVHGRHLSRQRSEHEEAAGEPQDVGQQQEGIGPGDELPGPLRGESRGIDAGPVRPDGDADRDAGEHHCQRGDRADEAPEEVVALGDRRGEEEVVGSVLEVLLDRAPGDRPDHRHADESQHADADGERVRAVDGDPVAAETHAGAGEGAAGGSHPQRRQRGEQGEVDPGRQLPQPPAEVEARDGEQLHWTTFVLRTPVFALGAARRAHAPTASAGAAAPR